MKLIVMQVKDFLIAINPTSDIMKYMEKVYSDNYKLQKFLKSFKKFIKELKIYHKKQGKKWIIKGAYQMSHDKCVFYYIYIMSCRFWMLLLET